MDTDRQLPLALVVGATGYTGRSIVTGLLESKNFRVAALVRPASASKPAVGELRALGVDIRFGDVPDSQEKLREALAGATVVISAVIGPALAGQKELFRAAKDVGVTRVIPCDFSTPGARGVRVLYDQKLGIQDFVKELEIGYTFIDVGWWMQLSLPLPERSKAPRKEGTYEIHGTGTQKNLVTNYHHIGRFVARIIADPRTLNQAVIVWEDEVTELEAHDIGERASGEGLTMKAKRVTVSAEETSRRIAEGKAAIAQRPTEFAGYMLEAWNEYMLGMHVLGENTLENAKRLGFLDAHELYPDVPQQSLAEFAKEYYALEEPGREYFRG
ncbi:NAD-P-binding protein [Trametes meyenii]|nr:NAD-P-binding protein [Trametes meyenii]